MSFRYNDGIGRNFTTGDCWSCDYEWIHWQRLCTIIVRSFIEFGGRRSGFVSARVRFFHLAPTVLFFLSWSIDFRTNDVLTEKLDFGKIKRDIVHISMSPREKALLLQALRWKLTQAKSDYRREKILECYIGCDLLGCRSDIEQRTKILQQLSSSFGGDTYYVKEEWARLINTIASLRKGFSR